MSQVALPNHLGLLEGLKSDTYNVKTIIGLNR